MQAQSAFNHEVPCSQIPSSTAEKGMVNSGRGFCVAGKQDESVFEIVDFSRGCLEVLDLSSGLGGGLFQFFDLASKAPSFSLLTHYWLSPFRSRLTIPTQ
jgi:hypothetical protein